jgi:hypothetical protein
MKKGLSILGKVKDLFFMTKFTNRGNQHDHVLKWTEDSPTQKKIP